VKSITIGAPVEIAQQNLGHASLATTAVYVTTAKKRPMRAMPGLTRELVYTGDTRAKSAFTLVTSRAAGWPGSRKRSASGRGAPAGCRSCWQARQPVHEDRVSTGPTPAAPVTEKKALM